MRTQNTTNIQLPPKLFSHLPTSMRKEEEIITSVLVTTTNILKALKRLYNCTKKQSPSQTRTASTSWGYFTPSFPTQLLPIIATSRIKPKFILSCFGLPQLAKKFFEQPWLKLSLAALQDLFGPQKLYPFVPTSAAC